MSVTHVLEYPVDIISEIDSQKLQATKRKFESQGWRAISWGVDSHDAIEFTIYGQRSDYGLYVSLYLAISENRAITYALQAFIDGSAGRRKVSIESGELRAFDNDDLERLLNRGIERSKGIGDFRAPLLAAVGAADLALERVNEIIATLRDRAGEVRGDAETRVEESRALLFKLQEDLPTQFGDLRGRLSSDELRRFAETYADTAQTTYTKLIERGEAALERLRIQPALEGAAGRVESYTDHAVELSQEALGNVTSQTRAVGERAAKLVGVELPKKVQKSATPVKKAAKKAPAKKAPGKKAAARKAHRK